MPRLVKISAKGPKQIGDKLICMCGLSKNLPCCDGSHIIAENEDEKKLYWYGNGKQEEIETEDDECCGCCDGSCQEKKTEK